MEEVEFLNPSIEKDLIKDEWFYKNYDNKNVVTVRFDGIKKYGKKTLEFINKKDFPPEVKFHALNKVFMDKLRKYLKSLNTKGKVILTVINNGIEIGEINYLEYIINFNHCTYNADENLNKENIKEIVDNCFINVCEENNINSYYNSTLEIFKDFEGVMLKKEKVYHIIDLDNNNSDRISLENPVLSKEELDEIDDYSTTGDLCSVIRVKRDKYYSCTLFDKDLILFINEYKNKDNILKDIVYDIFEEFKNVFEERMYGIRRIKMLFEPTLINLKSTNYNCIIGFVFKLDLGVPSEIELNKENQKEILDIIEKTVREKIKKRVEICDLRRVK